MKKTNYEGENLAEALRYAALGHAVYPVWGIRDGKCLCGGMKGCRPGKHPWGRVVPHGEKDATLDPETIRRWFRTPAVNVGVSINGFVVIDFDKRHGGMETLAEWERKYGPMPVTPTVKTGDDGRHFYLNDPGVPLRAKPAQGVDCLWGNGGGLMMPPSLHESVARYEWLVPLDTPLADMPPWLVEIVAKPPLPRSGKEGTSADYFDPMNSVVDAAPTFADLGIHPSGARNDSVNSTIGSMLAAGITPEQIIEEGLTWAARQEPPYCEDDLRAKVRHFAGKHRVEIDDLEYPQKAPLHHGGAYSPFAVSPIRHSPPAAPVVEATPPPIEPIGGEHYYGLVGDFVKAVEPYTEADPLGILACLLAGVGNALGRSVHYEIGERQSGNLFPLLVGKSGIRKGTCLTVANGVLSLAAPDWSSSCLEYGFGSGQGLVLRIRDARGDDEGEPDKRLLVVEEEFVKPLRLCQQKDNLLSGFVRNAFNGKPLSVMNRGENRYGCREPHLSVIGMTTPEELLEQLKGRSELYNGFLNRFLLVGVRRERFLSRKAPWRPVCEKFAPALREAMKRAATLKAPIEIDDEAGEMWDAEYIRLEQERPGNFGYATSRRSVHTLRVALIYAALDGSPTIGLPHLRAALSLIAHADRTALELFGTATAVALGEEPPHAKLLAHARTRPDGITKTDAHRLFANKRKAAELDADFALLTPAFGDWCGERWVARREGDMGVGAANKTNAVPETANGEAVEPQAHGPAGQETQEGGLDDDDFLRWPPPEAAPFDEAQYQLWLAQNGWEDSDICRRLYPL